MSKSRAPSACAPSGETPGALRNSMVMSRASAAISTGSAKVSAIWSRSVTGSASSDGEVDSGAGRSATSFARASFVFTSTRCSAFHGSAGRNCSARAPTHRHSPAVFGAIATKRSGLSSGPPAAGPVSASKKTVTGSQARRKRSGTTRAPSARTSFSVGNSGAATAGCGFAGAGFLSDWAKAAGVSAARPAVAKRSARMERFMVSSLSGAGLSWRWT